MGIYEQLHGKQYQLRFEREPENLYPPGLTSGTSTFGVIDNLTYTYSSTTPDRLISMSESGSTTKGFKYTGSLTGDHYIYDANGNLKQDKHTCPVPKVGKDLSFNYNHLNLPNSINNSVDSYITLTYTADGEKLTKVAGGVTRNYVAGIEYVGANLDAIYHAEGRCTPNGATAFYYEYTIKDHLGNARVNWRANGTAVTFLEECHYYPFGMLMEGIGTAAATVNGYKYNYKEINTDLGLNWYDYGARWYDPAVGRWWSVDPMAEKTVGFSVYTYALNNPALLIDPNGMLAGNPFEVMEERKQKMKERREESDKQAEEYQIENWRKSGDMLDVQLDEPTSSPKVEEGTPENTEDCCPEWMNNYLPVWSSGRDAYLDWQNGSYGWAIFNGVMAVSDVFLIKSILYSGGKILVKGGLKTSGPHTWDAAKRHWRKNKIKELTGGSKHHWGISQETMEKYPGLKPFGNQYPNIVKFERHSDHIRFGHGQNFKGLPAGNIGMRFWYGTPTWFKTSLAYGVNQLENRFIRE